MSMIALARRLKPEKPDEVHFARRRYAELLRTDAPTAKDLADLKGLMVMLDKTADEVAEDQKLLRHVDELRKAIDAAREAQPRIAGARKASQEWSAETNRMNEERARRQGELNQSLSALMTTFNDGQDAVEEINNLKSGDRHRDLLAHEQAASEAELKPIGAE